MGSLKTSSGVFCLIIATDMSSFVSCLLLQLVVVHFGPSEGRSYDIDLFRENVLEETNKLRRNHGLGILKEDAVLEKKAQKWADYLTKGPTCNRLSHHHPVPFPNGAENIFIFNGFPGTGTYVVDEWYNKSELHRFNMLHGQWTSLGVGIGSGCKRHGQDAWIVVALYTP